MRGSGLLWLGFGWMSLGGIKVHSHLMFKLVLSEDLGGILGGTQC